MELQDEIQFAIKQVQQKIGTGSDLNEQDLELLFLTSLIEEEA